MVWHEGLSGSTVAVEQVAGRTKLVPLTPLIRSGAARGTNFGD